MSKQQTQRKTKVVGTQQYINADTGELQEMQVTTVEERDFNFHKVWMKNFINTLEIVGNQKTKLCFWIIDNLNKENQLCKTYRQIAKETNMSLDTVRVTMKLLLEADFLRRVNMGCYVVNPDILRWSKNITSVFCCFYNRNAFGKFIYSLLFLFISKPFNCQIIYFLFIFC